MMRTARKNRRVIAAGAAITLVTLLAACGSDGSTGDDSTNGADGAAVGQEEIDAALAEGGELDFWAWGVQYEQLAELFQEEYPNVTVNMLNPGGSVEMNTKVQNAITANSGIPDVIQIESHNLSQFALSDSFVQLEDYDLKLAELLTPAALDAVTVGGSQVGLPMDSGPLVMFYREDILSDAGVEVPTTWEEYEAAASVLREGDVYIGANTGSLTPLIWASGGRPFAVDGETVSIDFTQPETTRVADLFTRLLADDLVSTSTPEFSPEWTTAMAEGQYATWIVGAWGIGSLQNRFPESSGLWRAAQIPTWDGETGNGINGGSSLAVLEGGDTHQLAVGFAQWMATSEEANDLWVELAGIPVTDAVQSSEEWLGVQNEYFGGQEVNREIAAAFASVGEGWSYLPFMPYAMSISNDYVGNAFQQQTDVGDALVEWGEALETYAADQGFTVE